jgi:hypothetical protein
MYFHEMSYIFSLDQPKTSPPDLLVALGRMLLNKDLTAVFFPFLSTSYADVNNIISKHNGVTDIHYVIFPEQQMSGIIMVMISLEY